MSWWTDVSTKGMHPDSYSLSGEDAYVLLTGEHHITMQDANSLVDLAARFGEVRVPFEDTAMAVGYSGGYYSVTFARALRSGGTA
jgi:hypothetical protein